MDYLHSTLIVYTEQYTVYIYKCVQKMLYFQGSDEKESSSNAGSPTKGTKTVGLTTRKSPRRTTAPAAEKENAIQSPATKRSKISSGNSGNITTTAGKKGSINRGSDVPGQPPVAKKKLQLSSSGQHNKNRGTEVPGMNVTVDDLHLAFVEKEGLLAGFAEGVDPPELGEK